MCSPHILAGDNFTHSSVWDMKLNFGTQALKQCRPHEPLWAILSKMFVGLVTPHSFKKYCLQWNCRRKEKCKSTIHLMCVPDQTSQDHISNWILNLLAMFLSGYDMMPTFSFYRHLKIWKPRPEAEQCTCSYFNHNFFFF